VHDAAVSEHMLRTAAAEKRAADAEERAVALTRIARDALQESRAALQDQLAAPEMDRVLKALESERAAHNQVRSELAAVRYDLAADSVDTDAERDLHGAVRASSPAEKHVPESAPEPDEKQPIKRSRSVSDARKRRNSLEHDEDGLKAMQAASNAAALAAQVAASKLHTSESDGESPSTRLLKAMAQKSSNHDRSPNPGSARQRLRSMQTAGGDATQASPVQEQQGNVDQDYDGLLPAGMQIEVARPATVKARSAMRKLRAIHAVGGVAGLSGTKKAEPEPEPEPAPEPEPEPVQQLRQGDGVTLGDTSGDDDFLSAEEEEER
jgi:hypothetical protein